MSILVGKAAAFCYYLRFFFRHPVGAIRGERSLFLLDEDFAENEHICPHRQP